MILRATVFSSSSLAFNTFCGAFSFFSSTLLSLSHSIHSPISSHFFFHHRPRFSHRNSLSMLLSFFIGRDTQQLFSAFTFVNSFFISFNGPRTRTQRLSHELGCARISSRVASCIFKSKLIGPFSCLFHSKLG